MSITRFLGFSEEYGSWKIICTSRCSCLSFRLSVARSLPLKRISRCHMVEPIMALPVVVLPEPDSPTRPYVCPCSMEKLTSSTALTLPISRLISPPRIGKCILSPSTFSNAIMLFLLSLIREMKVLVTGTPYKVAWCNFHAVCWVFFVSRIIDPWNSGLESAPLARKIF